MQDRVLQSMTHKSGHAMQFMKHLEETDIQCYSKNFGLKQKTVVTIRQRSVKSVQN